MLNRIRKKLQYDVIRPLVYDEQLRDAYLGGSVAGGILKSKNVLISGATGDIGIAMALRFLAEESNIILCGRNQEKLNQVKEYLGTKYLKGVISLLAIDLSNCKSIEEGVGKLKCSEQFIDVLVNNAGVYSNVDRKRQFRGVSEEAFDNVWKTNFEGTVYLTEKIAEEMERRRNAGSIINIASICAEFKHFQYTPYGMSKVAIVQYGKQLEKRYGSISIHTIEPGSVATKMGNLKIGDSVSKNINSLKHVALPEEIAALTAFLASDYGKCIANLPVIASACEVL